MKILPLGGILGPALFATVVVICGALQPGYTHAGNFISALGAQHAETASLMNTAGFVPTGLLLVAFASGLGSALPRRPMAIVAAALLVVFGSGIALAGVFSCDPGCPVPSTSFEGMMHDRVSALAFFAGLGGIALSTVFFRKLEAFRSLWLYTALTAVIGLVLLIVFMQSISTGELIGVWQRLFIGVLFTWCAVVGLRAFRTAHRGSQ